MEKQWELICHRTHHLRMTNCDTEHVPASILRKKNSREKNAVKGLPYYWCVFEFNYVNLQARIQYLVGG